MLDLVVLAQHAEHGHGLWVISPRRHVRGRLWPHVADGRGGRALEVGYHVRPALQGQGLATKAALACRDLARAQALAPRLIAIIHPDNDASANVATKIGMRELSSDEVVFGGHVRILGMDL